jgi:hypothetical protein
VLAEWAEKECDCTVFREQVLPTANPDHAEARMDIVAFSPHLPGPVYVDLTVVSALSVEAICRGSALRDGVAAEVASARKVIGFAVEDHGRFGEDALALVRALAPSAPSKRTVAIGRLYQSMAAALQRAAADAVLAAASWQ